MGVGPLAGNVASPPAVVLHNINVCVQVKHLLEGSNEALLVKEVGTLADCRQWGGAACGMGLEYIHGGNCTAAMGGGRRGQGKPSTKALQ
jgi:hypothetical protein